MEPMRVAVLSDSKALAARAAALVAERAEQAVGTRGRFAMAVSGGRTPDAMFAGLAGLALTWARIELFQVDERVAPDGHPDRNLESLRRHLLSRVGLPGANVHPMPVTAADLPAAARRYAEELVRVCGHPPVLDLVHLGLGEDGHTASLVPGDPALDVTHRDVALTGVHGGRTRMTLTLPAINRAAGILWLVSGAGKASVLRRMLAADPSLPAAGVRRDRAVVLADRAAAVDLPSGVATAEPDS